MDQWLRPVFQRTRTPVQGASTLSDDYHEADESMSRLRPASRVSSYIGFRSNSTAVNTSETFRHIRVPESVYHKPSGSQMVETLKVVMMTRNLMDSVPVEYNACILHVLEAYHDLQEQLEAKEREMEELRLAHARDIQDFETLAEKWVLKEKDYQKEMKNLEILLSKKDGGMEDISMARSRSVVHGSRRAADVFEVGLDKIKRNAARYSSGKGSYAADWDAGSTEKILDRNEGTGSTSPKSKQAGIFVDDIKRAPILEGVPFASREDRITNQKVLDERHGKRLTTVELEALHQKHAEEEMGVVFDSSSESDDTSLRSMPPSLDNPKHMPSNFAEKPLPDIPVNESGLDSQLQGGAPDSPWVDLTSGDLLSSSRKGFSFRPGDDLPSILHKASKDTIRRRRSDEPLLNASRLSYVMSNSDVINKVECAQQSKSKTSDVDSGPLSASSGYNQHSYPFPFQLGIQKTIARGDSSSSIVTAVRDSSVKSESGRSRTNKQETAVMAAVRAIAANNKTTSNDRIQTRETYVSEGSPFKDESSETSASSSQTGQPFRG